jgi:hypothetical protein
MLTIMLWMAQTSADPYASTHFSDFFNFNADPSTFTPISAPFNASKFLGWTGNPQPPDNDGD